MSKVCVCDEDDNMKRYLECRWWEHYVIQDKDISNMRIRFCPFCGKCLEEEDNDE